MAEGTVFYKGKFERRFPIPILAYERLEILVSEEDYDTDNGEEVVKMYIAIMEECCGVSDPEEADITYFLTTVNATFNTPEKPKPASEGKNGPAKKKKGYATDFYKMIEEQDTASLILNAVGFDYKKAEYLYCVADRTEALLVVEKYLDRLQQDHRIMLESSVYGFGGDMGDSNDAAETKVDIATGEGAKGMFAAMNKKI